MITVNSYRSAIPQYSFYSIDFDGVNERGLRNPESAYRSGDTSGTISCWVKPTNGTANQKFFSSNDTPANRIVNFGIVNNKPFAYIRNAAAGVDNLPQVSSAITDGVWTHVAISSNGSAYKMWVNGASVAFGMLGGSNDGKWFDDANSGGTPTDYISIGCIVISGVFSQYYAGKIDDLLIHNTELSSAQMTELYNGGRPMNPNSHSASANLVAAWLFDGDTMPTITDSKNSKDFTAANMEQADINTDTP